MIDFIKISTTNFDYNSLINHSFLTFTGRTNLETNELTKNNYGNTKVEAVFYGLKFIIYNNETNKYTLSILGSLHKFFNQGHHNYNDFTINDLINTLNKIKEIFELDLSQFKIHNIEIGVNIIPPAKSKTILKGLLSHQNIPFKRISMDNADYYQASHGNYFIKAYDKAKQYKAKGHSFKNELLRFELKYVKAIDLVLLLKKNQIISRDFIILSDLTKLEVLEAFGELLLQKWNEILFYDYTISKTKLLPLQIRKLDIWQNINQWENFKKQKKTIERKQLQEVIDNHSINAKLITSIRIKEKLDFLLQKPLPSNHFEDSQNDDLLTTFIAAEVTAEVLPSNSIYKPLNGNKFKLINDLFKGEEIVPDYDVFHADTREIPF